MRVKLLNRLMIIILKIGAAMQLSRNSKLGRQLKREYSNQLNTLDETVTLAKNAAKLIMENGDKTEFMGSAHRFALISIDTPDCIISCLKEGHIAQACVLLRWYLESAHLFYYLWKNAEKYEEWLSGAEIRPKDIGKYFQDVGFANWRSSYEEWSKIVHLNHEFVSSYHITNISVPANEGQMVFIGQVIRNTMWTCHKFNYVMIKLLQQYIGEQYDALAKCYNKLEEQIIKLSDEQNKRELDYMR